MALPTSTTNLDTATINGIVYTYNSTKGAWYKQSTASTSVPVTISGTLSVSGNANVGNLGSPTVVNGNSNVTVTANSAVSIAANGAVRMTVDATGNVGIGNAAPTHTLSVTGTTNISGNANVGNLGTASATLTGNLNFSGTGLRITGDFSNATISSRTMFQTSTLNSPTNVYAIPNGSSTTTSFSVSGNNDPGNAAIGQFVQTGTDTSIRSTLTGTGSYTPITFYTSGAEKVRIDINGNVGIGTSSPSGRLDVAGTQSTIYARSTGAYNSTLGFYSSTSTLEAVIASIAGGGSLLFGTGSSGTERMRIDSGGNVGIANTAPTHTLSVTGTTNISGNANVGNIGTAAVVATANITNSARYVKTSTGGIQGGAQGSITRYPTLTTATYGDIHITSSLAGNSTVALNYGLTFQQPTAGTQAGILISENTTDGTALGFYNSNNYGSNPTLKLSIEPTGHILPGSNVAQNLGSTTLRWSTVYTGDLELSNGIGDYTIVEGEDDLFLYNNRSGKTYRFMLQEVDPAIVPPKKGT